MAAELTLEVLDALLSPTQNAKAEEYYQSIPLVHRMSSLVQLLPNLLQDPNQNGYVAQSMLACVLLRRNIQSLGGMIACNDPVEGVESVQKVVEICKHVVDTVLALWSALETSNSTMKPIRRQMAFVVAEIVSTLLLTEENSSVAVVNLVLEKIAPAVSSDRLMSVSTRIVMDLTYVFYF